MQAAGLQLTIIGIDEDEPDVPHVEIRVWTEKRSSTTSVWMPVSAFLDFAEAIADFPAEWPDARVIELGHRHGEAFGGMPWVPGFCQLQFESVEDSGWTQIRAYLEDDNAGTTASRLTLPVDGCAVGSFAAGLRRLAASPEMGAHAILGVSV